MAAPDFFNLWLAASLAVNILLLLLVSHYRSFAAVTNRTACTKCGYDVRTTLEGRCPECGTPVPARPAAATPGITRCSFCGRSNLETGVQAEGPGGVHICVPCVEHISWMVAERKNGEKPADLET